MKEIISIIKKSKAKNVLLQFPEGMKNKAIKIVKKIEKETNTNVFVWLNSCYGVCDIPLIGNLERRIDVIFSFGHSLWPFEKKILAKEINN